MESSEHRLLLKPLSSLEKCFLDENILFKPATDRFTVFCGQPLTFQVAVSISDTFSTGWAGAKCRLPVRASGALAEYVNFRVVVSVPVHLPDLPWREPRTVPAHRSGALSRPAPSTSL